MIPSRDLVLSEITEHGEFSRERDGGDVVIRCMGCKEVVLQVPPAIGMKTQIIEAEREHVADSLVRAMREEQEA